MADEAARQEEARAFIDAYACVKLEMDRLKKHEDELDFFALELESRRVWLDLTGLPIAIYGIFRITAAGTSDQSLRFSHWL